MMISHCKDSSPRAIGREQDFHSFFLCAQSHHWQVSYTSFIAYWWHVKRLMRSKTNFSYKKKNMKMANSFAKIPGYEVRLKWDKFQMLKLLLKFCLFCHSLGFNLWYRNTMYLCYNSNLNNIVYQYWLTWWYERSECRHLY